ncbi:MAG: recombinase family protein [Oscillospiraceae bacterium]|nr:recombinase family protein [Oscillospiraceae bacterium]
MPTVTQVNAKNRLDLGFVRGMTVQPVKPPSTPRAVEKPAPPKIRKIAATKTQTKEKLKVAAYCRVSTMDEAQEGSIYAQRRHYERCIRENPDWILAGIYFEQGLSATKTESRPELQRMLADCRAGKINLILTKSISRFSRNTSDCIAMVRGLTALGVTIRFEKENIDTGTMESEFMLSLLSCMAESESHSISANGKWAIRKRFETGTFKHSIAPYGYRKENGSLVIDEEQAAVVRDIFSMVLSGYGFAAIADELNARSIPGPRGTPWLLSTVSDICKNPAYMGDVLYQKHYVDDNFKFQRNKGELDQFYHENHHEAIISRETFELAERNVKQRERTGKPRKQHALSGKLICGHCGRTMKRASRKGYHVYECSGCGAEPEENVKNAFITCLNKLAYSQTLSPKRRVLDVFIDSLDEETRTVERLREIDEELENNQLQADVLTAIALVNHFTPEEHARKMELLKQNDALRREKVMLATCATGTVKAERLKEFVTHWKGGAFPEDAFAELVESVAVTPGESVVFRFTCGLELKESMEEIAA